MNRKFNAYRKISQLPDKNYSWPLYGEGFNNLGRNGEPVISEITEIKSNELLLRVDALGICFSDVKVINAGNKHIRLMGRDLQKNPVIVGHEASVTVVKVGDKRANMFKAGERYVIQPDIYYKGNPETMGYVIEGALQQYIVAGNEIIESDEGSCLLPLDDTTGYAESSLCEPFSCIEAAYNISWRDRIKNGGTVFFIGCDNARFDDYSMEYGLEPDSHPRKILLSNIRGKFLDYVRKKAEILNIPIEIINGTENIGLLCQIHTEDTGFDDIIILGTPAPELIEALSKVLAKGGILSIISELPISRKVGIDAASMHYDGIVFTGTANSEITNTYKALRSCELVSGGSTLLIGAGGPMGQMHIQRAIYMPDGPSLIVSTDIDKLRINELRERISILAKQRDIHFEVLNPNDFSGSEFNKVVINLAKNNKYDDIIILASVGSVIEQSACWLGKNGIMNIFAGVPKGTTVMLDMNGCIFDGHRWVGHSGTSLKYMVDALQKINSGILSPNNSIAAVGGLKSALESLKSVKSGRYIGKVIIYPQLLDFPLVPLEEMLNYYPNIAEKMDKGRLWTNAAEQELLESQL